MNTQTQTQSWTYREYPLNGSQVFVVRSGERVVAMVKSREDAERICRGKRRGIGPDVRQKIRIQVLAEDNRLLVNALRRVSELLRRSDLPEINLARHELQHVLKRIKGNGASK